MDEWTGGFTFKTQAESNHCSSPVLLPAWYTLLLFLAQICGDFLTRLFLSILFFFFFLKYYRGSHLYRLWRKYFPWTCAGLCSLAAATFSDCTALSHPLYSHPLSLLCRNHPHLQFPLPGMFISQSFHLLEVFVLAAFISWRFPWLYNNAIYPEFLSPFPYLVSSKSLISLTLCISFVFFTSMGAGADFCLFHHCIISIHKSVLCIVGIQHVC